MDRALKYFELQLFDGNLVLPLKFCMSYVSEETTKASIPLRTGIDGRPTNRIFVLAKNGCDKISDVKDIDRVLQWGEADTYLNTGSTTKPVLVSLDKFEGVAELLAQDKERSKERDISSEGIYPLSKIKPHFYNGRNFHTYPHTENDKTNEKWHNIYRLLALFLKLHDSFLLVNFFCKGQELGALYEDDGVLKVAGLHASKDLKPIASILKFSITKGLQKLVNEKFDKLRKDDEPNLVLSWRDFVAESLEHKGVAKDRKMFPKKKVVNEEQLDKDLKEMFSGL